MQDRLRTVLGQETSRGRMQTGLYLLAGGFVLGLIALGLFFFAGGQGDSLYRWREGALILGAIAITAFFVGVSQALPAKQGMRIASYIGVGLCALAILLFSVHYPANFNVQDSPDPGQRDYTALDTSIFAVGLAVIVAGAFVSVIGYYIQLLSGPQPKEEEEPWRGKNYEVPDWVVEQDLDDAQKRHGVSWGLGDKKEMVQIEVADFADDKDVVIGGKGKNKTVHLSAGRVDRATETLKSTRPDIARTRSLPGDWTDDAVAKLVEFQREKEEDPKAYTPKLGFWARLFGRRARLSPVERDLEMAQEGLEIGGSGTGTKITIEDDP